MTLRWKTVTIVVLTLAGLIALLYGTVGAILLHGFLRWEQKDTCNNVERALSTITKQLAQLDTLASDWAWWDDSVDFVQHPSDEYINANLVDATFGHSKFNVILYLNSSGDVVYGKAVDKHSIAVPKALIEYVRTHHNLVHHTSPRCHHAGLILLPEGPMMVSLWPIVTSEGKGPVRGTLLMGRYLEMLEIRRLAQLNEHPLTLHRIGDTKMPPDCRNLGFSKQHRIAVQPLNDDQVAGYVRLRDINGKPVMLLRAVMSRDVYKQGLLSLIYLILSLVAGGLAFGVVNLLLLERSVLSRLARLSREVINIGNSGDLSKRVPSDGNDEISGLSNAVNEMLTALQYSQGALEIQTSALDHLAHHDPLTGLPNRLLFSDRLTQNLAHARRQDGSVAVMFLDLDRFKMINDTLGHNVGDLLLKAVADRLTKCLKEVDTIARMGGDEFTIIHQDTSGADETAKLAEQVLETLRAPFYLEGHEMFVSASIGISLFPSDGEDVESLVKNADTAMYRAKELGRNNYQLYTEGLNAAILERMTLEKNLRKALEREEFVVYYQPRINLRSNRIMGVEALVRWQHPELGLVPPGQFIPLAEETGLIVPITDWVLQRACLQNKEWQDAGFPPIDVAVNISARHFQQDDLTGTVRRVLQETGLEARYLDLEITESSLMHNPDVAVRSLEELKNLGVRISIDDFGTGYSSLSYLKKFPINTVKIDQSFVRDITSDPDDAAIAAAVVAMAHSLNLKVVAEGVETLGQLEFLKSLKCDEMQGYFVSRPVPFEDLTRFLVENKRIQSEEFGKAA